MPIGWGKGANLAEMGLSRPAGSAGPHHHLGCLLLVSRPRPRAARSDEAEVLQGIKGIEAETGRGFGDSRNPLLLRRSLRRALLHARHDGYVLNLGLNDETVQALGHISGRRPLCLG